MAAWLGNWIWITPYAMLAYVILLFPTGQPGSPRWRPALWLVGGALTLATLEMLAKATSIWGTPYILLREAGSQPVLAEVVLVVEIYAALSVSVAACTRRSARRR